MPTSSANQSAISHEWGPEAAATRAAHGFANRFGRAATWIAFAPGRVNLIGEHTDYNDGFVLPMAIDRYTAIAAARSEESTIRLASAQMPEESIFAALLTSSPNQKSEILSHPSPPWARYVLGTLALCADSGLHVGPLDVWIDSDVPLGAGLSSSAALEVATATLAEAIAGQTLDPMAKARLCQQAEHQYAGMPCGIMDQAISVCATLGHALLLDCRTGETRQVAMDDPSVVVLIANSNVKHALCDGEYASRRADCHAAASALGIVALRDASLPQLDAAAKQLNPTIFRRARHVITENDRTLAAAEAIARRNWTTAGQLMYESHVSMRDDFEISCPEIDVLVEAAKNIGEARGVFGSRMTGGGFGGCTVSLVKADSADRIADKLRREYRARTGIEPTLFVTSAAQGTHIAGRA
ncbi:MAG: galactokinase [Planctomycetia bacterium]|nr:galactokinase [Planctomycetia bacterium]